jgi:hypothetical protein
MMDAFAQEKRSANSRALSILTAAITDADTDIPR